MLTLEQVRAVNDGFASGDLNAALQPLEETIDLRANELPRLDKKAVAALKDGLKNGDDAATWAQAILHPNISVRRFARKIFMGLGDEAAPIFAPLRARLERFWAEEEPLPYSEKSREAALRREQEEQVSSAVEILLRADPEAFLVFYAQLADNWSADSSHGEQAATFEAWQKRNQAVYKATQEETTRLIKAEWGEKFADGSERWKLPSRVLREMDEHARANPEIAEMWRELGESPWLNIAPAWNSVGLLMGAWNSYLNAEKPTGPIERVNVRLRPVLKLWIEQSLDFERELSERETIARRLILGSLGHQVSGWLGQETLATSVPPLLIQSKARLLPWLQNLLKYGDGYGSWQQREGEELVAVLWLALATALGQVFRKPYSARLEDWELPPLNLEDLREIVADLPDAKGASWVLSNLKATIANIEKARDIQSAPQDEVIAEPAQDVAPVTHQTDREILSEMLGHFPDDRLYPTHQSVKAKIAAIQAEAAQMKDEERIQKLVEPEINLSSGKLLMSRLPKWKIWANNGREDGEAKVKAALWPRAEPLLWARYEAQLEAHRRVETEAVEPDIAQKLTPNETKEWRTRVRREKREIINRDVVDIANLLIHVDGLPARLKAIELADRPSCREICQQLERGLFYSLEEFPGQFNQPLTSPDAWEKWKLDDGWDAILAKAEARYADAKDEWNRNVLERELATGYYRRGDFAKFARYATRLETFPPGVAAATVAFDDFVAWQHLLNIADGWQAAPLATFWQAQLQDETRRNRAVEVVARMLSVTDSANVAKLFLDWFKPLEAAIFMGHVSEVENALESTIPNVKKWAIKVLSALPDADFDRERAAQTAGEMLWSDNAGLAKDAAKFLSVLAQQEADVAAIAWDALCDATSLENLGLCEAVYRALVKIRAKYKSLELSEAAREKLDELASAQSERFGKFAGKL